MQFANGVVVDYDLAATLVTATPTYTTLGEVYDVSGFNIVADTLEGSVHGSTYKAFVGGLIDAGNLTVSVRFKTDDTAHNELRDQVGNSFLLRIQFPESDSAITQKLTYRADVFMTNFEVGAPHDGLLDAQLGFRVSGAPEWTDEA